MAEKGLTAQEVAPEQVPEFGTFWSFQRTNYPPLPFNKFPDLPVYYLGYGNVFLVDDSSVDYVALEEARETEKVLRQAELKYGLREADALDALEDTEGGGMMLMSYAYPTNNALWLEITSATNGFANLVVHGTVADETYEILSKETLTNTVWASEGTLLGAAGQDWTATAVLVGQRTNSLFLWARSWQDSDGDGLPDWWELAHGLDPNNPDTGNTGVSDGYKDSDNDGWSNLQEYQNGTNPNSFNTPPPPIPFNAFLNPGGSNVTLTWNPPPGSVLQYLIERADPDPEVGGLGAFQTIAQPGPGTLSVTDNGSFSDFDPDYGFYSPGWSLPQNSIYRIRAIYAGGQSQTVEAVLNGGDPTLAVDVQLVRNASGRWQLLCPAIPPQVTKLRLSWFAWDYFWDFGYYLWVADLPVTNLATGVYVIPDAEITQHLAVVDPQYPQDGPVPAEGQVLWVQGVDAAGKRGRAVNAGKVLQDAPCFTDGRAHLKQNLLFQLRAATLNAACSVSDIAWWNPFYVPVEVVGDTNYVESSFLHRTTQFKGVNTDHFDFIQLNDLWPFTLNYQLHNRLYDPSNTVPTSFEWQTNLVTTPAPAVLGVGTPYWIAQDLNNLPGVAAGITGSSLFLQSGAHNLFGLAFATALVNQGGYIPDPVTGLPVYVPMTTLAPGGAVSTNLANVFFSQTMTPALQPAGYYFAPVFTPGTQIQWGYPTIDDQPHPLPVNLGFAASNQTPLLIASDSKPIVIGGWAKLAITNGYNGKFAYLGQYFDKALKINTNGVVTTNQTGILSPYGEFFPTEPGPTALITMPDLDTNQRGTAVVQVVKLQLDVNHDGNMDLSFAGPDNTAYHRPFTFWVNNDFDRLAYDADDKTNYEDSVEAMKMPGWRGWLAGWTMPPDGDNRDGGGNRVIPTQRDLEDFTRLWVCGITTNLLAALPPGTTITLDWGDVGNPDTNNPAIDLFQPADADGGIGYLTNAATAALQTNASICRYVGRLGPGQQIQLNGSQFPNNWAGEHLIWCGVGGGTGQLNLTISQGGTNTLAQTSAYIQLVDIKQMYERWTVGDNPNFPPTNHAYLAQEDLPPGISSFQYGAPTDTNTPYILFVHGWNLDRWIKDRFAETAFKRLYWQGYQGRFGSFRWPTDYNFHGTLTQLIIDQTQRDNFDRSEYQAYRSAPGLLNLLTQLHATYGNNLYLYAVSHGNMVCGEALRLAGTTQVVNTYVPSQAAVTAHTYDPTVPNYSFLYLPWSVSADTPNTYGGWFAGNNGGGVGRIVNFFNANDYALQRSVWQLNQLLKPDQNVAQSDGTWNYAYNGSTSDPSPWNHFSKSYV